MENIVLFDGENRWLSNFWPVKIEYKGLTYDSVEAAYQAAKCWNPNDMAQFVGIEAKLAKTLGRKVYMRSDWDRIKLSIMHELLLIKFRDAELAKKLLDTWDCELIEGNHWHDTYWGVCDGKGLNHLGRLLMEVRENLFISAELDREEDEGKIIGEDEDEGGF
jgi:ribA/ribD-fused uncharacterized protein